MSYEINRQRWEDYRLSIYAQQAALERTVPRFLAAAIGGKEVPAPEDIPSFDEVDFGKMSEDSTRRTVYDMASEDDTFVTYKWWEHKGEFESSDKGTIRVGGQVKMRKDNVTLRPHIEKDNVRDDVDNV